MSQTTPNFIVRMYHFISGEMSLVVKQFEDLAEAIEEAEKAGAHSFKIYDKDSNICHDSHGRKHHHSDDDCDDSDDDTYA